MYKRVINPWLGKPGYNCIGCSPDNPIGLHMQFYAGDDETLWGEWNPGHNYQGWVNVLHGGIQSLILDEAAEWWINVFRKTAGMTVKLEVKYHKPIMLTDGPLKVKATFSSEKRSYIFIHAELINNRDEVCTSGEICYYQFSREKSLQDFGFAGSQLED
ncbi:MAG: PaaI family thioesterase [Bacteroidales bacterium]|nr:PaaI family thioesterase [Bacteroidales bacterium]